MFVDKEREPEAKTEETGKKLKISARLKAVVSVMFFILFRLHMG